MSTIAVIVVIVVAAWVAFSAYAVAAHKSWVVDNLAAYGVPRSWWPWLASVKALGALGLLVGIWVPAIGLAAAAGLVLYFLGAVLTVLRARVYAHIISPMLYLTPVVAAGVLLAA